MEKTYLDINEAAGLLNMSVAWLRAQVLNRKILTRLAVASDSARPNWNGAVGNGDKKF